jgi:hypothetical protein
MHPTEQALFECFRDTALFTEKVQQGMPELFR